MKEYRKIDNVFKFDSKYNIIGLNKPYNLLSDIYWIGTEKVDGTNVRVYWDGHKITLAGRTDKSQWQGDLYKLLSEKFLTNEMEYLFEQVFGEKEAYIFGEGYGPKIQKNGELYSNEPSFIVFDVTIDGYELNIEKVEDVAKQLGLEYVPIRFEGTLSEAMFFVEGHPFSYINFEHEMEGLVLTPRADIFDSKGHRIKCKLKWNDIRKIDFNTNITNMEELK